MTFRSLCLLALALTILIGSAVPATAVELENPYLNGMSLGSLNGEGTYTHSFATSDKNSSGYYSIPFELFNKHSFNYIDVTIKTSGAVPSALRIGTYTLTRYSIGNSLYRYFGAVSSTATDSLVFNFTAGGAFTFSIVNMNLAVNKIDSYRSGGQLLRNGTTVESWTSTQDSVGVSQSSDVNSLYERLLDFQVKVIDWKGADFVEVLIRTEGLAIGSIMAYHDSTIIPIQVDSIYSAEMIQGETGLVIGGTSEGSASEDGSYFPGEYYDEFQSVTEWSQIYEVSGDAYTHNKPIARVFRVRLDLRGVDRTSSSVPLVRFSTKSSDYFGYSFKCGAIDCTVIVDGAESGWLANIRNWILDLKDSIIGALTGNLASNQFKDESSQKVEEFEENMNQMDNATGPPIDDVDTNIGSIVDPNDINGAGAVLDEFTSQPLVDAMLVLVVTIALAGFALYGKE